MEQNSEPRNNPMHVWLTDLWQECQEYTICIPQQMMLGKLDYPHKKEWNWTFILYLTTKMNSKYLIHNTWNSKTPRRKHRGKASWYLSWQWFHGCDTKRIGKKTKNKQVGLYQTKKLLHKKETINRVKREAMKWEKIFANHISDKG